MLDQIARNLQAGGVKTLEIATDTSMDVIDFGAIHTKEAIKFGKATLLNGFAVVGRALDRTYDAVDHLALKNVGLVASEVKSKFTKKEQAPKERTPYIPAQHHSV